MQRGKPTLPAAALAGAVDLSSLKRPPAPAPVPSVNGNGSAAGSAAGSDAPVTVIDVTQATFAADVIERSREVPVVLDFWAAWCEPCKQFSPVIEKLAGEGGGSWVLARIDVDANPQLATAAGVQGIPTIKAVVDGQIVAEFSGAMPEASFRQWITALLEVVGSARAEAGATGEDDGLAAIDPRVIEAEQALERGDADAAEAAYRAVLAERPEDPLAAAGLAQVALLRRVSGVTDPAVVLAAAEAAPDDQAAQLLAADVELLSGRAEDAFTRLIGLVVRSGGAEREAARTRLLSLFELLGPDDPQVVDARRKLMVALF